MYAGLTLIIWPPRVRLTSLGKPFRVNLGLAEVKLTAERDGSNGSGKAAMFLGLSLCLARLKRLKLSWSKARSPRRVSRMEVFDKNSIPTYPTYNTNQQTPDSAGTATAFLSGVKTRAGVLGVDARVEKGDCTYLEEGSLETMVDWALNEAVRHSLRDREMRGSIPGRVKPRTLKLVLAADPPSVWHYGFSGKSGRPGVSIMLRLGVVYASAPYITVWQDAFNCPKRLP
ncbi:alkaline phosphatase [Elysia marginata]|uniref:alkaline phosphatase n=1 Tax=Elysia marginata TaxID=1093978 RepID=A0AAV4IBA8_9GAST|nr:alkaline phosphatase [Elysia marginata]